jgi:hypothetical protein
MGNPWPAVPRVCGGAAESGKKEMRRRTRTAEPARREATIIVGTLPSKAQRRSNKQAGWNWNANKLVSTWVGEAVPVPAYKQGFLRGFAVLPVWGSSSEHLETGSRRGGWSFAPAYLVFAHASITLDDCAGFVVLGT